MRGEDKARKGKRSNGETSDSRGKHSLIQNNVHQIQSSSRVHSQHGPQQSGNGERKNGQDVGQPQENLDSDRFAAERARGVAEQPASQAIFVEASRRRDIVSISTRIRRE